MQSARFLILLVLSVPLACREKEKKEEPTSLPAVVFIRNQVADVDTSFYPIIMVTGDENHEDTSYIKREQFAVLAHDFLTMPDISESPYDTLYREESFYDKDLNRVVFTYTAGNDTLAVRREEVHVIPNLSGGESKIDRILVHRIADRADSTVEQYLSWKMDHYFQVVSTRHREGTPDSTTKFRVIWNYSED